MKLEVPTKKEYQELVTEAVNEALERELPRLIRKATRKQYLNTEEAMGLLSCTRKHLYYLRKIEALPYIKEGKKIYYDIEDIEAYMENNRVI
jgi:hypothetical protein